MVHYCHDGSVVSCRLTWYWRCSLRVLHLESQATGRERTTEPPLNFWNLKARLQRHTYFNKAAHTPSRLHLLMVALPGDQACRSMSRWWLFIFKPPQWDITVIFYFKQLGNSMTVIDSLFRFWLPKIYLYLRFPCLCIFLLCVPMIRELYAIIEGFNLVIRSTYMLSIYWFHFVVLGLMHAVISFYWK